VPLELNGVGYVYGAGHPWAVDALADVSLTVSAGQLVLVVGPTGSGKSTLLRIASGLLAPSSGGVSLEGAPLTPARRARGVGLVFQNPESQLFAETVLDDVAFGPSNLGLAREQARNVARESLAAVGIDVAGFADRSPFGLSGGEARRVAIAGVISMKPAYLLADEPTAGLDANGREAVRRILRELRADTGIVVVTHDAEEFLAEADDVLVLDGGRTVYAGSATGLVADPAPLDEAGLRAPPVLAVQILAREAGIPLTALSLDPREAARALALAGGWVS
jgi:energy-coupling factor transport system ATP-binding protein